MLRESPHVNVIVSVNSNDYKLNIVSELIEKFASDSGLSHAGAWIGWSITRHVLKGDRI